MKSVQKLTPSIRKAIQIKIENPFISNIELAGKIGKHHNSVNAWFRSPVVLEEYNKQVEALWKDSAEAARVKMVELASKGDYKANEFILKCNGYNPAQEVKLQNDSIKINIVND